MLSFLLGIVTYPWIEYLHTPIYYGAIISTIVSVMITTMVELYMGIENKILSDQEVAAHKQWLKRRALTFRPMPHKYMLLNDIQLFDDFAGLLLKLGYQFF